MIFAIALACLLRQQHLRSNRLLLDAQAQSYPGGIGAGLRDIARGMGAAY